MQDVEDWEMVIEKIVRSNMGPMLYAKIPHLSNSDLIPDESMKHLKQSYFQTLSRGSLMYQLLRKTVQILREHGIEVIVLKGAYLAEAVYEDIALRLFSDIDLLLRSEEEARRALDILVKEGYEVEENDEMLDFLQDKVGFIHLPQVVFRGIPIELHARLHRIEEDYDFSSEYMWEHHEKRFLNGLEMNTPDPSDLLIHVCIHLDKHFKNGKIQLTGLNDIVNILEIFKDQLDWSEIIGRSIKYNCEDIVFKYIMLAHKEYDAFIPHYIYGEYINFISEEEIELFHKYLSGFKGEHFSVVTGLKRIKSLSNYGDKIKYVLWMMFPSRKYMMRSYKLKNKNKVWMYYPYRFWLGIIGGIRSLRHKKKFQDMDYKRNSNDVES